MLKFEEDKHGLMFRNNQGEAWILPRPAYCDRGRYNWAQNGFSEEYVMPSMYFFDLEAAKEEISAFVFSSTTQGRLAPNEQKDELSLLLQKEHSLIQHPSSVGTFMKMVPWPDGSTKVVEIKQVKVEYDNGATENVWEISQGNIPFVDMSDQFPRHFRFIKNALSEMNAFIACRQLQALEYAQKEPPRPRVKP